MLLLAGGDIGIDLVPRFGGSFQMLQVLLRTVSAIAQKTSGRCPLCCSISSIIGSICSLSLAAGVTLCPTIKCNAGSTAAFKGSSSGAYSAPEKDFPRRKGLPRADSENLKFG